MLLSSDGLDDILSCLSLFICCPFEIRNFKLCVVKILVSQLLRDVTTFGKSN